MITFLSKIFGRKEIDPNDIEMVVKAYGKILGNSNSLIRDISELPLAKSQIAKALIEAIKVTPSGSVREQLKASFVMLGDFQDLKVCKENGIDPMKQGLAESEKIFVALEKVGL